MIPASAVEYEAARASDATVGAGDVYRVEHVADHVAPDRSDAGVSESVAIVLADALARVEDATERRVNAERDRDAAVERERSERQAREAAEAEVVELRARVTHLEAIGDQGGAEAGPASDDASGLEPAAAAPRREWWRRMLGGA